MFRFANLVVAAFALPAIAAATTIDVNTVADQFGGDSAHCSLREAIQAANTDTTFGGCVAGSGTDLILLDPGTYTLTRSGRDEDANATGDLDVSSALVVLGIDAEQTRIDAAGIDRVLHVAPAASATLIDLTVAGGDPIGPGSPEAAGGGVWADGSGALSLNAVHVTGNRAYSGGGVRAEHTASTLTVTNSTFSRNASIYHGGAISTSRELRLTSSTISGNTAGCTASALLLGAFADAELEASTIVDNHGDCTESSAPQAVWTSSSQSLTRAHDTIIAGNFAGPIESNCNYLQSDDYNLLGAVGDCDISGTMTHVLTGFDPKLAPLFDYGGTTPTHALYPDSPAIGTGAACRGTDQRGVARAACDIGAYAYRPTFTVNETDDAVDADPGDGTCASAAGRCTLRAAIMESNTRDDPTLIVLPAGDYPLTIERLGEEPNTTGWLYAEPLDATTLIGAGAGRTRILGAGNDDAMLQANDGAMALARLSISGGHQHTVQTAGGVSSFRAPLMLQDVEIADSHGCYGGFSTNASALLDRVSIHGNAADSTGCPSSTGGGIHVGSGGEVDARNVTVSGNHAEDGGGGVDVAGGTARLLHATIADNTAGSSGVPADGGGLYRSSTGAIYLKNSIVAGNLASGNGDDCSAVVQSQDFNLVGDITGCTIGGATAGNLSGVDARLDPLTDGGNGLPVHGLAPGSPALDAVGTDNDDRVSACRGVDGRLTLEDQRRHPRDPNAFCDIGAYEGIGDRLFVDAFEA